MQAVEILRNYKETQVHGEQGVNQLNEGNQQFYSPHTKRGYQMYSNQEQLEKIIWNTFPQASKRDFEVFDGPRAIALKQAQAIL